MSKVASFGVSSAGLMAQRKLTETSQQLGRVYERLSSGQRITRASDDAASLSISTSLSAQSRVLSRGLKNLNDGVSFLNVTDSALNSLTDIVIRQQELAEQSANGTYSTVQRSALQNEMNSLNAEYNRIVQTTRFNQINALSDPNSQIVIQDGVGTAGTISVGNFALASLFLGNGTYGSAQTVSMDTGMLGGLNGIYQGIGDFNGDGYDDIVLAGIEVNTGFFYQVFQGSANGTLSAQPLQSDPLDEFDPGSLSNMAIGVGDTNGDGRDDLHFVLQGDIGGITSLRYYSFNSATGSASVSASAPANVTFTLGTLPSSYDFNGDGVNDQFSGSLQTSSGIVEGTYRIQATTSTVGEASLDISTIAGARSSLSALRTDLNTISSARSSVGAAMSRLEASAGAIAARIEGYESANSRIRDADVAFESAEAVRLSILQQSAVGVLQRVNQEPRYLLSLLRN